jgi:Fic family protein
MSSQIETERKEYYLRLERCQRGTLDITIWLEWFLECLDHALAKTASTLSGVIQKARIWEIANIAKVNSRQQIVINRLLDGFQGNLTTSKYSKLAKCSEDTALRDIRALMDTGILIQNLGGGRSTSYSITH